MDALRLQSKRAAVALVYDLGEVLKDRVFDRPFVIYGYDSHRCEGIAQGLRALEVNYVILEPRSRQRSKAEANGHAVIGSLSELDLESPFVIAASPAKPLSVEELCLCRGRPVLLNLRQDRTGFDIKGLQNKASQNRALLSQRVVALMGSQPIAAYRVTTNVGEVEFLAVAAGRSPVLSKLSPPLADFNGLLRELDSNPLRTQEERRLGQAARSLAGEPINTQTSSLSAGPHLEAVLRKMRRLAKGPCAHFSLDEIRRLFPELGISKTDLISVLKPNLEDLKRVVDRGGDEPNLLLAAHLAHFMLGLPAGISEAQALEAFFAGSPRGVRDRWGHFTVRDVHRLRQLYPFIPDFPNGVRAEPCRSLLNGPPPDTLARRLWDGIQLELEELSRLPLVDETLETYIRLRGESGMLAQRTLIEATGVFGDLIPRLDCNIRHDGLNSRDHKIIAKHYSSHPRVVDVIRRVFGTHVMRVAGDDAILEALKVRALDYDLVHEEGILGFWPWFLEQQRRPDARQRGAVSHTSSDLHDLMAGFFSGHRLPRVTLELMALAQAKERDELLRFKRSFLRFYVHLAQTLDEARLPSIWDRPVVVQGYGPIIGSTISKVLRDLEVDYVVTDVDPEALQRAQHPSNDADLGHPTTNGLDDWLDRSPVIISCAGCRTIDADLLQRFSGQPILINFGSGRYAFDMEYLEKNAERKEEAHFGILPVVSYKIRRDGETTEILAVADGCVANLGFANPANPAYSILTQLLVEESLRQVVYRQQQGLLGFDILRSVNIDVDQGVSKIILHPRTLDQPGAKGVAVGDYRELQPDRSMAFRASDNTDAMPVATLSAGETFWENRQWRGDQLTQALYCEEAARFSRSAPWDGCPATWHRGGHIVSPAAERYAMKRSSE